MGPRLVEDPPRKRHASAQPAFVVANLKSLRVPTGKNVSKDRSARSSCISSASTIYPLSLLSARLPRNQPHRCSTAQGPAKHIRRQLEGDLSSPRLILDSNLYAERPCTSPGLTSQPRQQALGSATKWIKFEGQIKDILGSGNCTARTHSHNPSSTNATSDRSSTNKLKGHPFSCVLDWQKGDFSKWHNKKAGENGHMYIYEDEIEEMPKTCQEDIHQELESHGDGTPRVSFQSIGAVSKKCKKERDVTIRSILMFRGEVRKRRCHPSDREEAITLAKTMAKSLKDMGSSLRVGHSSTMPQMGQTLENDSRTIEESHKWNLVASIAPEIHVLDRVLQELVQQVGVHCHERGRLLERVRAQYWKIVEEANSASSLLKNKILCLKEEMRDLRRTLKKQEETMQYMKKQSKEENETIRNQRLEIEKYQKELEDGKQRLRRGRFDIIQEELCKYKAYLDKEVQAFVDRTQNKKYGIK